MGKDLGRQRWMEGWLAEGRSFPEHNFHSLAPALVNSHELPFNLGRKIAQQRVRGRMHVQRGSHQKQQRLFSRELSPAKISEAGKFSAGVVPLDS